MKKNPVACAAGLATLEILIDQQLPERARQTGEFAVQKLQEELNDVPTVSENSWLGAFDRD